MKKEASPSANKFSNMFLRAVIPLYRKKMSNAYNSQVALCRAKVKVAGQFSGIRDQRKVNIVSLIDPVHRSRVVVLLLAALNIPSGFAVTKFRFDESEVAGSCAQLTVEVFRNDTRLLH